MGLRITGLEETRQRLEEHARRARDLGPFLAQEAALAEQLIASSFASRSSPAGEAWPSTRDTSTATDILSGVELVPSKQRLTFRVTHPASGFFAFGTSRQPPRNFLPIDRSGQEIMSGAAGEFWRGHAVRLERYLGDLS